MKGVFMITIITMAHNPADRSGWLLYMTLIRLIMQAETRMGIEFQATGIFGGYTGIAARLI
jgi:hypothetical protein